MDTQKRMLKLCIDIALAVLLVGTYMTGHVEPHAHAPTGYKSIRW